MNPYRVLEGWNSSRGDLDYDQYHYMMFSLAVTRDASLIVETGLGFGGSTRIWLEALSSLPNPETRVLHTFDLMEPVFAPTADKIRALNFPARWELHQTDSRRGGEALGGMVKSIDLLYLDSDHQYPTVASELETFSPWITERTLILAHDSCPASEHASFTHGKGNPSDTYLALRDWGEPKDYGVYLFPHPNGVTLLVPARLL